MRGTDGAGGPAPTPASTQRDTVVGAVLIGGGSRRMGRDKAQLVVEGEPLLARTVRSLVAAIGTPAPPVLVIGPHPDLGRSRPAGDLPGTARWVSDLRPDAGPLAGLETALASAVASHGATAVLVAGVDHPWLEPTVLARLLARLVAAGPGTAGVALGTGSGPQLLLGAYRTTTCAEVRSLLDSGERRLQAVRGHLDVEVLPPEAWRDLDPLGSTALDVDDPASLAAATRWRTRAVATAPRPVPGTAARPVPGTAASGGDQGPRTHRVLGVGAAGGDARRGGRDPDDVTVEQRDEALVGEAPLAIEVVRGGRDPVAATALLSTPGEGSKEVELTLGWLLAEGFARPGELASAPTHLTRDDAAQDLPPASRTTPLTVRIHLERPTDPPAAAPARTEATSGTGVTTGIRRPPPLVDDPFTRQPLSWPTLAALPGELRLAQGPSRAKVGSHAAGLADSGGRLVTIREDVSRHHALDTVIGAHLRGGVWPEHGLTDLVCVLSCRVGAALVVTAAIARIPVLVAVGGASDLAVHTAGQLGITLVGALRGGSGTVYTHPHRLDLPPRPERVSWSDASTAGT